MIVNEENKENSSNGNTLTDTIVDPSMDTGKEQSKNSERKTVSEEMSKFLGEDQDASKLLEVNFHPELKDRWQKWMQEGLPKENKKSILEVYPRKGDLFTEAPKVNLEIVPVLTEIAIKRDQHFIETQNCVGSAISALGAAISMLLDTPEEGIEQDKFTKYLCDTGQLLTEVFYQHSIARKAFITPLMNKAVKPTLEAAKSDQWLYGEKFAEQVKEAKSLEKACANIKAQDKKASTQKTVRTPGWNQGNVRYPSARYWQVGYPGYNQSAYQQNMYQRKNFVKFKPKTQKTSQPRKSSSQTTNRLSSKK